MSPTSYQAALPRNLGRSIGARRLGELYVTHPQNPGLATLGKPVDVPVSIREAYRLEQFCDHKRIGLIVIGPEEPLAEGFADKLAVEEERADGLPRRLVFGPT